MKASYLLLAAASLLVASVTPAHANPMPVKSENEPPLPPDPTLSYHGGTEGIGVISGQPQVYIVFWGSQWGAQSPDANGNLTFSNDPSHAAPYLQRLFKDIGTGGEMWSAILTQYCDGPGATTDRTVCPSNAHFIPYPDSGTGVLAGVWYDNASAEPAAATLKQLGQEALRAAAHFGNTDPVSNRYVQYVIVSSTGMNPDAFFSSLAGQRVYDFCGEHSWNGDPRTAVSGKYGDIVFVNLPYVTDAGDLCGQNAVNAGAAGLDDGFSIVAGHEYAETLTDPVFGGWYSANTSGEIGDECAFLSGGGFRAENIVLGNGDSFAMQGLWSNADHTCEFSVPTITTGDGTDSAPAARAGSLSVNEGIAKSGTVSATDSDGDPLIFIVVAKPAHGALSFDYYSGQYTYTSADTFSGTDIFTFNTWDGTKYSNTAAETLHVNAFFSPPSSMDEEYMGCFNGVDTYAIDWTGGTSGGSPTQQQVDYSEDGSAWSLLYSGANGFTKITVQPGTTVKLRIREGDGTVWSTYLTGQFTATACKPIN